MPVIAEQPELNARRIRNNPSGSRARTGGGGSGRRPWAVTMSCRPNRASNASITTKA